MQTSRLRHGCLRRGRGKRGVLPLFLLAVLLLAHSAVEPALVAAQEQKKQVIATGGIYRRPLGHDPETLDPARITDIYSRSVSQQIFDGLVQFDQTLTVAPALAEFWRASRDGLTWTFTLRKGVRFHNGREMTAEDVVYSLARLLDPKTRSGAADLFSNVRGGREFREGRAKTADMLKGCTTGTWKMDDAKVMPDGASIMVLTYKASGEQTCDGKKSPSPRLLDSRKTTCKCLAAGFPWRNWGATNVLLMA